MEELLLLGRGQHRLPIPRRRTRRQLSLHRPELRFQLRTATDNAQDAIMHDAVIIKSS